MKVAENHVQLTPLGLRRAAELTKTHRLWETYLMQQANIEGQVLMQFVVEPDGHVTRQTIEIMSSTHRAFEGPARDMIQRCLFRPGKVRTSSVRVLVQMPVVFALQNRR